MKIDLSEETLSKYDDFLKDKLQDVVVNDNTSLEEHGDSGPKRGFGQYNLLAHLSTYFNNDVVVDIGTGYQATSARALSYNETNTIYSYDTEYSESAKQYISNLDNVTYNIFNPLKSLKGKDIMLSASLISLDVDPHDGVQEREFYCFFVDNNWKGIMVCDDIRLVYERVPGMASFWESVDKPKYDLTTTVYSHHSGTGLICFDDQEVFLNLDEDKITDDPNKWVFSKNDIIIQRFDDGTFENNYGVTGTWNMVVDAAGEEKILIKTKSGSIEVSNF